MKTGLGRASLRKPAQPLVDRLLDRGDVHTTLHPRRCLLAVRRPTCCPEAGSPHMIAPYLPDGIDPELAMAHTQPWLAPQRERSVADKIGDVAGMILFLASDESLSCTGADFTVDGGNTAGRVEKLVPGA